MASGAGRGVIGSGGAAGPIVVIGGGPAGSTAATRLAQGGHRVLVLERERFPRPHIGESLLPATLAVLEQTGALADVVAAGFTQKWGATMRWGRDDRPWSWYFRETNQRFPHSFQVERPRFDAILLDVAARAGAEVRQSANVVAVDFDGDRVARLDVQHENGRETIAPALVIDASGQRALIARTLDLLDMDAFFRNLAVFGYFDGAEHLAAPDQGNIFIESYPGGWFWKIPLGAVSSVGAVVDRDATLPRLRRLGAAQLLREELAQAPHTARMLANARLQAPPQVLQDWSYRSRRFTGNNWILAGDAACFVDPLFSTGVHLAVTSGFLAAALARSLLETPAIGDAARAAYAHLYGTQYAHFHRLAQLFYSGNRAVESYFWEARRLTAADAFTPREGFVRAVSGQPPAGYENAVLGHGDLPRAFVDGVAGLRTERAQRRVQLRAFATPSAWRPRPVTGVALERRAVLGAERFEWSDAIVVPGRDDAVPCSELVAAMLRHCDGRLSLGALARQLADADDALAERVLGALQSACEVLHADGLLEVTA